MGVRALHTAATGMEAQLQNIDVIANNMANINTHGFRKDRINFADLFYNAETLIGSVGPGDKVRPSGIQVGNGVRVVSTQKIFTHGGFDRSGGELDLAIANDDNLFFKIQRASGQVAYTRNGNFTKDENGNLVTADGDLLDPAITIPQDAKRITIARNGTVTAFDETTPEGNIVGQITLTRFLNPGGLKPVGDNLFVESPASGAPAEIIPSENGNGHLLQFHLEHSNVQAVKELINLIQAQRSYEINSNVIRASDQALQLANNLRA
ncbi:MAG: flagellar basal-body rod protein FlgG [Planctomycetes bacterium]|nr:flagellar basal-body rod protein FlgG [Planctomycetota bacterium]